MTIRMFFTILAGLSFLFGVGFVLAPDQVLANYGIEHSPALALLGRLFGGALLTLGVILWHDRDTKYTISFRAIIESGRVKTLPLPARSPNLNAYAERWVRSVKEECLSKIIVFGERSLRRALSEYVAHYQAERNHQGKSNVLLFRRVTQTRHEEPVQCRERLGGLLNYYHQEAA